jgi:hypothetical protein
MALLQLTNNPGLFDRWAAQSGAFKADRQVCPVTAIFALDDLPEKWQAYTEINKNYVDGGKFQPDKYQKASS